MNKQQLKSTTGFALPTVMIASVVMLMVLLSGLVAASSTNAAIRAQYEQKQIGLAADAGVAMANACLMLSNNIPTWDGKTLRPNTDCNGDPIVGAPAGSEYVLNTPTLKTTFQVPTIVVVAGTQRVAVTGTLQKFRSSSPSTVVETSATQRNALIGAQTTFNNVMLGYCAATPACQGSQLAVVLATGEVKTLGKNDNGRLGIGSLGDRATPGTFILPSNERGVGAFSNFLSAGRQISVLTANGKVFSAGNNEYGQLGNGALSPVATPVQFGTLGNGAEKARYVSMGLYTTFVVTDQNVYSAGLCDYGLLGWGCTSGTSATAARISLPAYNSANLNTQPATTSQWAQSDNVSTDSVSAYIRMKGGAVYGWGSNFYGQLGNSTYTDASTPVKVGTFGDAGQPFASKISFDGVNLYVLDSTGSAWAVGTGENGESAGAGSGLKVGVGLCLDSLGGGVANGTRQGIYTCLQADTQSYEWYPDGTVRLVGKCLENQGGVNANLNPIIVNTCNGSPSQQWVMNDDKTISNPATGKCLDNENGSSTLANYVVLYGCTGINISQQWTMTGSWKPRRIPFPAGVTSFSKITTDQRSVLLLDNNGDAWGAGFNTVGELGNGTFRSHTPALKKVTGIPVGRDIKDIYTVRSTVTNSYFVLDDGTVYGSGQNNYGQLGTGGITGNQATPVQMQGFPTGTLARSVQTGYGTTVVISSTGRVFTIGNNSNGQLGDGTTTSSSVPKANQYTNQRSTITY
ncbi:MAG: ricin-type beta-trefoil lectin domain protein [Patescibacteria group bacterium]